MSIIEMLDFVRKQQDSVTNLYTAAAREGRRNLAESLLVAIRLAYTEGRDASYVVTMLINTLNAVMEEANGQTK